MPGPSSQKRGALFYLAMGARLYLYIDRALALQRRNYVDVAGVFILSGLAVAALCIAVLIYVVVTRR
jgi:hypothetical protein